MSEPTQQQIEAYRSFLAGHPNREKIAPTLESFIHASATETLKRIPVLDDPGISDAMQRTEGCFLSQNATATPRKGGI